MNRKILKTRRTRSNVIAAFAAAIALTPALALAGDWLSSGQSIKNERHQADEEVIGSHNVGGLQPLWELNLQEIGGGDVWTTPAVDNEAVYFPDSNGFLYKVDRQTGEVIWQRHVTEYAPKVNNFSRTTPAIEDGLLIIGDQGNRFPFFNGGAGASVMAVDTATGNLVWITEVDDHLFSIITQAATIYAGKVLVGVSSYESAYSVYVGPFLPADYDLTSKGSMVALKLDTGEILWQTYTTTDDFSGASIWGSAPSIDVERNQVFAGTGQNFDAPQSVLDCVEAAYELEEPDASEAARACLADYPDNRFDSIIAFDLDTGAINWSRQIVEYDVWHAACIIPPLDFLCPTPTGTDADFGQAPIVMKIGKGKDRRDVIGVGQKSGVYWLFDAATGETVWSTRVSPGGIAGGLQWGSAYDGTYIYTSSANSNAADWTLVDGTTTSAGIWSALDPETGEIIWQTANPSGGAAGGAASVANGVVYACSLDPQGMMYALDADDGAVLWSFASGGSCNSGAAIADSTVYWGSGYASGFDPSWTSAEYFRAFGLPAE